MRIVKPSFEIWPQEPGLDGVYRQVERVGRVCYKSEDRQAAGSARPFVERMIANQHYAMLEHGTVYLTLDAADAERYRHNAFSRVNIPDGAPQGKAFVTTNLRVLAENGWMDDLARFTDPTPDHALRVSVHFTTQIAISREFNRHRADSMAEQSTRYCNYARAKFSSEIAVCMPTWVEEATAEERRLWEQANATAEKVYMDLIAAGRKPQEARVVLPLDTATELVHTAFLDDWRHFFDLRAIGTTGAPHPDARALAQPLYEEFQRRGWA